MGRPCHSPPRKRKRERLDADRHCCHNPRLEWPPHAPRSTLTRRDRLELLIRWLPEAISAGGGNQTWIGSGPDSKTLTYGPLYHANCPRDCHANGNCRSPFTELLRCLALIDVVERKHLIARYHAGTTNRRPIRFRETKLGRVVIKRDPQNLPPCTEIIASDYDRQQATGVLTCVLHQWPTWVSNTLVNEALDSLEALFRGEVDVPRELLAA